MKNSDARRVSLIHKSGNSSLISAGFILKRIAPDLVVSKQKLRQAQGSCLVRMKREERHQILAFSSRPFVLCGLPVRSLQQVI